jgi:hypothetical protein
MSDEPSEFVAFGGEGNYVRFLLGPTLVYQVRALTEQFTHSPLEDAGSGTWVVVVR